MAAKSVVRFASYRLRVEQRVVLSVMLRRMAAKSVVLCANQHRRFERSDVRFACLRIDTGIDPKLRGWAIICPGSPVMGHLSHTHGQPAPRHTHTHAPIHPRTPYRVAQVVPKLKSNSLPITPPVKVQHFRLFDLEVLTAYIQ